MKTKLLIDGMHCAGCANAVDKQLEALDGVRSVQVNLTTDIATVEYDQPIDRQVFAEAISKAGFSLADAEDDQAALSEEREEQKVRKAQNHMWWAWGLTLPMILWMLPSWIADYHFLGMTAMEAGMLLLSAVILLYPGKETMVSALRSVRNLSPNMDVLIAMGSLAAWSTGVVALLHTLGMAPEFHSFSMIAGMIMAFHLTGRYIETRARGSASKAIRELMKMGAKEATIIRDGKEEKIPVREIQPGDLMLIKPGEKIPTDGRVVDGESMVDESLATGESMPVNKSKGDELIGATINRNGVLKAEATRVGSDTFLSQVIRMVEEAQGSKVPIQDFADRITAVFVPVILGVAALTLTAWMVFPGLFEGLLQQASVYLPWVNPEWSQTALAFYAAIAVLVIACPCALGLATPTAIMVGSGKGAENGILIRNGEAIQVMKDIDTIVLDKTGTLTNGRPVVTDILTYGHISEDEMLLIAASLERNSEHPIADAIVRHAKDSDHDLFEMMAFESVTGKGVKAKANEKWYWAGSAFGLENVSADMADHKNRLEKEGKTVIFIGEDKKALGLIAVADQLKDDSADTVNALKQKGLQVVMLTGDNRNTAQAIAKQAGISEVEAEVMPGDKSDVIKRLQQQGRKVAMVGDGINDAPALTQADVGIAIGTGTDIAIESGDIVLVGGNLSEVLKAITLSKATFKKIRQNMFWAFFYNLIMIPLAVVGMLHPLLAEAAMAFSSINVVMNSRRLNKLNLKKLGNKKKTNSVGDLVPLESN